MATVPKHDMIADLKRYLSHPAQPILLNDLVMLEVERVRDAMASDPSYAPGPHLQAARSRNNCRDTRRAERNADDSIRDRLSLGASRRASALG